LRYSGAFIFLSAAKADNLIIIRKAGVKVNSGILFLTQPDNLSVPVLSRTRKRRLPGLK